MKLIVTKRIKNELIKKIKSLKENLKNLKQSRHEVKNYKIYISNKEHETNKLEAGNTLFMTIKEDLDNQKHAKIDEYENFYKKAQESSKGI